MIRFRSYRGKLQAAFLLLGLTAIGVTGYEASIGATNALRQATFERLAATGNTRCRQLERYFEDVRNHVLALSTDESTITALEEFDGAWAELNTTPDGSQPYLALREYYEKQYAVRADPASPAGKQLAEWFPADPRTRTLQYYFLAANPHPPGAKDMLLSAPATGRYGRIHARYHPTLHRYQSAFGFYDIFLINSDGRILYTVLKEIDLGANLRTAPYRDTTLARAFEKAMRLEPADPAAIEDYAPYAASYFAPAAFLAAPVWRAGSRVGVLAIQVSVAEVNRVMTGDGHWQLEGLGQTGQSYVVGPDGTLRSDVRFEIERPQQYYQQLLSAGVTPKVVDQIRRNRTAILNLPLHAAVLARIRSTERGTEMGRDFRGVAVLRSHTRASIPGLDWVLISEIETEEAFGPVRALQRRILIIGVLVALVFFLAARLLAASVTRPVRLLAEGARKLGEGDFHVRIQPSTADEIGQLAQSFNRMAEDLERTTVSKQELDRVLSSMINAVFVVRAAAGADASALLDGRIAQTNRSALDLLRYPAQELAATPLRRLIPPEDPVWLELLQRVLDAGRVPAMETSIVPWQGAAVPVLLTAARLSGEPGDATAILLVAQDISDWKAAQGQLRRMSKVYMDAADPIVLADLKGHILDCNAEAERCYGWPREQLRGLSLCTLLPPPYCPRLEQLLAQCLAGIPIRNLEARQVDRAGRTFPVLLTLSLLKGEGDEASGVAMISKDITDRERAENALRQKQRQLEELAGRLITAQEEERRRLARELHDDLTQRLAALAIDAGRLEHANEADPRRPELLERIKQQTARLSHDVHRMSRRLHPSTLDDLGLVAAIESECRSFFERGGPPVEFQVYGAMDSLPREAQLGLYRIVQEALRNIYRHAGAEDAAIRLERRAGMVELEIRDSGRGFDAENEQWRPGLGLASMEERAQMLGGQFQLWSRPGEGTRIVVRVPLPGESRAEDGAGSG